MYIIAIDLIRTKTLSVNQKMSLWQQNYKAFPMCRNGLNQLICTPDLSLQNEPKITQNSQDLADK